MKVAYLIVVHNEFAHLKRLLNSIQHPQIDIYLHLDNKAKWDVDILSHGINTVSKIYILDDRAQVTWGGYGLTAATILLLQAALENGDYDYLSLLSGQDFPLHSAEYILQFLLNNKGNEFVEYFPFSDSMNWKDAFDRFEYFWPIEEMGFHEAQVFVEIQKKEGIKRGFPAILQPFGGSNWFTISSECAEYICKFLEEYPCISDFFKYVMLSEEIIFPSIVLSSPFKDKVINNNLKYIDWNSGPQYPRMLSVDDLPGMMNSGCLFARKFEGKTDSLLLNEIEKTRLSAQLT